MKTFRPNPVRYRGRFIPLLIAIVIVSVLVYWRLNLPAWALIIELMALVAVVGIIILLYFSNALITARPGALTVRSAFRTSNTMSDRHLAKAVLIEKHITSAASGAPANPRLFLLDDDGHAVLHWSGKIWTLQQMHDLVGALEMPLTVVPGRIGSADIHRRYPHALGTWEGHPVAFAGLIVVGLAALSVIVLTGIAH